MSKRDVVAEIEEFNAPLAAAERRVMAGKRDLTAEALQRKLQALKRDAFAFFRGTFHLFARDVLQNRVPLADTRAPDGLIVGDLHLENFGAYRGASGAMVFDVNDFDDTGFGPVDLDVKRLCTSALLVPGVSQAVREKVARAIADAWAAGIARLGGRFPVRSYCTDSAEEPVKSLLAGRSAKELREIIARAAPEADHKRFADSDKYVRVEGKWHDVVAASLREYRASLEQLKADLPHEKWELCDVAYRFKGTGSLGRLRFSVLVAHADERRIVEIKEARLSAMDEIRGIPCNPDLRARMQTASIRRLQGDMWPHVAGTHLGKAAALARDVQPEEEKISCERMAGGSAESFASYGRQCGEVLARLHVRESAPALFGKAWDPMECSKHALAFAHGYAEEVRRDFDELCRSA